LFPCHFWGWIIWNRVLSIDIHVISFDFESYSWS
jgi:hypothetical protein